MPVIYHAWSSMPAQSVRLALRYKGVPHKAVPLADDHDALFFELGLAIGPLLLTLDDQRVCTDAKAALEGLDGWLGGRPIFDGLVKPEAWDALHAWLGRSAPLLARLTAAVLPAFADVGASAETLARVKAEVEQRFGMSIEALSNDRYEGYRQLERVADLRGLAAQLARSRYFTAGTLTAADLVLACQLFPLQLLDGVTLPIDLLYYIDRVEKACGASPREGLLSRS
ncbi:glutathione S-transferase [Pelomicrobium methylotrophicum]|uniref:Glutathione S-transferase n=1 Tax=Pelomicrobium methylotrophicum TaxID=2602750 RepID=A0A5C7EXV4_9PROT|nr:glutathione S-transferase [Pelomicrobium methylotrophicum]TXF13312.1 glutathione S-transferase [Pelomicrobium methylotrophicum]